MIYAASAAFLTRGPGTAESILGIVLGAILQRRGERVDRLSREALAELEQLKRHLSRSAAIVTSNALFPSPIAAYGTSGVSRDAINAGARSTPDGGRHAGADGGRSGERHRWAPAHGGP